MALMDVHADGQEMGHERIRGVLPDLLEVLDRTEIIALRDGHELLAQLASELPEPGRTLRAQRGEGERRDPACPEDGRKRHYDGGGGQIVRAGLEVAVWVK